MHLDKTGFIWPCTGCTQLDNTKHNHIVFCLRSNIFGNNTFCLWVDSYHHPAIPKEYSLAYQAFDYAQLHNVAQQLIHYVGTKMAELNSIWTWLLVN